VKFHYRLFDALLSNGSSGVLCCSTTSCDIYHKVSAQHIHTRHTAACIYQPLGIQTTCQSIFHQAEFPDRSHFWTATASAAQRNCHWCFDNNMQDRGREKWKSSDAPFRSVHTSAAKMNTVFHIDHISALQETVVASTTAMRAFRQLCLENSG